MHGWRPRGTDPLDPPDALGRGRATVPRGAVAAMQAPLDVAPDDPRIARVAEQFAERFRPYCAGMPEEAFARLVRHAAWIRLRWP